MPITIKNPFAKMLCPYCLEKFYLSDCQIISSSGEVLVEKSTGIQGLLRRTIPVSLTGGEYMRKGASRYCPCCRKRLPHNMDYMNNLIVALVGGQASGKSHYIASLIQQFEHTRICQDTGCSEFVPIDDDVERRYLSDYYTPLFINRQTIPKTHVAVAQGMYDPLIYAMAFGGDPPRRANLILFDAAGEDLEDQSRLIFTRYVLSAAGIIFLVDPMTIEGIRSKLPAHLRAPIVGLDGFRIINKVMDLCRRERGLKAGDKLDIPAVIVLAKSDLLDYVLPQGDTHAQFQREPNYQDGFNSVTYQVVSDEIEEIIERFDCPALSTAARAFSTVSFAAVSATGGPPDQNGRFPRIAPRRCADPVLWVLWKLRLISSHES